MLECVNYKKCKVIFQKNVYLKLLVLQCVKVGVIRVTSEGLTPTTSVVRRNAQSGCNLKAVSYYKNVVSQMTQNKVCIRAVRLLGCFW